MNNLSTQLNTIGLTTSDINKEIESTDELVRYVSSSHYLFRKALKHILFRDIQMYFDNETINPDDDLAKYFPRKGRGVEWIKFSSYLDLRVPGLKLTRLSIVTILFIIAGALGLIFWLVFSQTELLIHSILTGISLIPIIVMFAVIPLGLIAWRGETALPARTIDDLTDEIIGINLSDLLSDDKEKFKEIITKELTAD